MLAWLFFDLLWLQVLARAPDTDVVTAMAHESLPLVGVQFHPEVDLTLDGKLMLRNFLFRLCGCSGTYTRACRRRTAINMIRDIVGDQQVLVLASGGVDSSVCAALLTEALSPSKVLFIDH